LNEPTEIAVQQAIEKAVLTFIVEGAARGLWSFSDRAFQEKIINDYELGYLVAARESPGANPAGVALAANAAQKVEPAKAVAAAKPASPAGQGAAQAQAAVPPAKAASGWTSSTIQRGQPVANPPGQTAPQPPAAYPQRKSADASGANVTVQPKIVVQHRTLEDEVGINPR
jgi:curli production assembly/transport component CsgG